MTNAEVVQTMYDGFGAGDIPRAVSVVHPDVEWIEMFPYRGIYRGAQQLRDLFERVADDFDVYEMTFDEWVADGDRVVVLGSYRVGRKGRLGVFESRFVHVFWVRNEQVVKYEQITDTRTAGPVIAP